MFCPNYSLFELAQYLGAVLHCPTNDPHNIKIEGVVTKSRHCVPQSIFVAIKGATKDGHSFIQEALNSGSVAYVTSDSAELSNIPALVVQDARDSASSLAALFAKHPSKDLLMIGVTGTNGKTTTHWIISHILEKQNLPCLRIGTLGAYAPSIKVDTGMTTPDAVNLQDLLRDAKEKSIRACVMEVSSHALDQKRVEHLNFDVCVYTNLSRDHLDYHKDMETYFLAKKELFVLLSKSTKSKKVAVVNIDCPYGQRLLEEGHKEGIEWISYGRNTLSKVRISSFVFKEGESRLNLTFKGKEYEIISNFIGNHNASNLSASFACGVGLGFAPEKVADSLCNVPQVSGRLELVHTDRFRVYVDYAHTPDALERALSCVREVAQKNVWVIFGCGGDRDKGKRPIMGEIARKYADKVVLTSDNPRTEDPLKIIEEVLSVVGSDKLGQNGIIEVDRRKAIYKVMKEAKDGDVILIAGKGHEDYQIIGKEKIHFSDQEEVRRIVGELER